MSLNLAQLFVRVSRLALPQSPSEGAATPPERASAAGCPTTVWINELHYDNEGSDVNEGFELAGVAGTDLTGLSVVLYNGNGGAPYGTAIDLSTTALSSENQGFGFAWIPSAGLQNGSPDGLALMAVDGTGAACVVQFLSYEGAFVAVGGPADGVMSQDIVVAESGTTPVGQSLQLAGEGTQYSDFAWAAPVVATMGSVNAAQTFPALT